MKTITGWLAAGVWLASIPAAIILGSAPAAARPALGGVPGSFVYVCTAEPCQYGESFSVYDQWSNPLLAVSETADITSFGLGFSVTPLGSFADRMTMNWESPDTYQRTLNFPPGCIAPHWEIAPSDSGAKLQVWHCVAGVWRLYKTL